MPGEAPSVFTSILCQMEPLGHNKILTDNPINAYFPSGQEKEQVFTIMWPIVFGVQDR